MTNHHSTLTTPDHLLADIPDVGICIRSRDGSVVEYQNNVAKQFCGVNQQLSCELCSSVEFNDHLSYQRFGEGEKTVTIISEKPFKKADFIKECSEKGFTPKEIDIAWMKVNQQSNESIMDRFKIGKPTVKTHINHIFQKWPELRELV